MSFKTNTLPIGKLLKNADLISDEQLELALVTQSQYTKMRLGEILGLQEAVKVQTVDFFADKWQIIKQEGQHFPLGYYLKKACLLNEKQIKIILTEQKNTQLKFGDIAVQKGWVKQGTVDFFLNELASKAPSLMSLIALEKYNQEFLHLEKKYANYSLILSRILAWTGGNSILTKAVCNIFANEDLNIPPGKEINVVDKLIEGSLIRNWQTTRIGTYIRSVRNNLINNQICEPVLLLAEYQAILLSDDRRYQHLKEQEELLNLGIIVTNENQLRVTNLIFQQIFNQNWIAQTRKILEDKILQESANIAPIKEENIIGENIKPSSIIKTNINRNNIENIIKLEKKAESTETLTKFSSLLTLAGIVFLIPLVLVINNYSSDSRSQIRLSLDNRSQATKLKQFCNEANLVDPVSALELISHIEKNKEAILRAFPNTLEGFPDNCETVLNRLRVLAAPQLGKESRVIEAIKNLCKIPADAENINEAKIWIEHWYTSSSWSKKTKSYLNLINDCPAGK